MYSWLACDQLTSSQGGSCYFKGQLTPDIRPLTGGTATGRPSLATPTRGGRASGVNSFSALAGGMDAEGVVGGSSGCGAGGSPSSLDSKYATSARSHSRSRWTRAQKRAYHRVMSGFHQPGQYRFVTLTSSPNSKRRIQDSWRVLKERLRRRGLLEAYFCVPEVTRSGLVHLHLILRGSYIAQALLSKWWAEIHQAPVVDIRLVKFTRKAVARYVGKYVSKDLSFFRWSCSWSWVWRGFCRSWEQLKRVARNYDCSRTWLLQVWRIHCCMALAP